jgi:hypothetical protein
MAEFAFKRETAGLSITQPTTSTTLDGAIVTEDSGCNDRAAKSQNIYRHTTRQCFNQLDGANTTFTDPRTTIIDRLLWCDIVSCARAS